MRPIATIIVFGLLALAVGGGIAGNKATAATTTSSNSMSSNKMSSSNPAGTSPIPDFKLHVDAKKHFPGDPNAIAHHWCRPADGGIIECALFSSDAPNAQLVGVEVVVPTAMWKTFSKSEQALWHYHRVEIPKVSATMPGMSAAEAKKVTASLMETYGKV
jgi:hypothetical protein